MIDRRFSVAPMMDWTDRHCRFFHRQLTRRGLLYTEMVVAKGLIRGEPRRLLPFSTAEHPVALQLGGSDPAILAAAARIGADWGYDEINLNCGCPSDRVQSGRFGACLMAEPALVARCVAAMAEAVPELPVTVKCRIGIDDDEPAVRLRRFVAAIKAAGCRTIIVHARKAWLNGLSPKDNRTLPPLDYPLVYAIKAENPDLELIINGGITDLDQAAAHLRHVDGVMLGRAAYENPMLLAEVDRRLHGQPTTPPTAEAALDAMIPYVQARIAEGAPLNAIARHMLGLFHGRRGARAWRRALSETMTRPGADARVLRDAYAALQRAADATRLVERL